jgi:excisionase family DNA binding protein
MTNPTLMTVTEAAASLGVSARTVERMLRDGRLPSVRIGAARMIGATDVDVLLRHRAPKSCADRAPS